MISVQVNTEGGKFYVSNGGLPNIYSTVQFHFHWGRRNGRGSEHTVDSKASPLEVGFKRGLSKGMEYIVQID